MRDAFPWKHLNFVVWYQAYKYNIRHRMGVPVQVFTPCLIQSTRADNLSHNLPTIVMHSPLFCIPILGHA